MIGPAAVVGAQIIQSIAQQRAMQMQQRMMQAYSRAPFSIAGSNLASQAIGRHCNYCWQHSPGETCKQCGAPRD